MLTLPLHDTDWHKLCNLCSNAERVRYLHHCIHILVCLRRLFDHAVGVSGILRIFPCCLASPERAALYSFLRALDLDIMRPAPCAVEPKLSRIELGLPSSIQLAVPIEPGTSTGCPTFLYLDGTSPRPAGNALVAPLRCTTSLPLAAVNLVLFYLCNIVRHVIDQAHSKVRL